MSFMPFTSGVMELPPTSFPNGGRKVFVANHLVAIHRHVLPTDPIGSHALNLLNVVAGSRVHIASQDGATTHYDQVAAGSGFVTVSVVLDVYAMGSPLNDWRIRVRRASAGPYYIPYETLVTSTVGGSSIYVSQIPDE